MRGQMFTKSSIIPHRSVNFTRYHMYLILRLRGKFPRSNIIIVIFII